MINRNGKVSFSSLPLPPYNVPTTTSPPPFSRIPGQPSTAPPPVTFRPLTPTSSSSSSGGAFSYYGDSASQHPFSSPLLPSSSPSSSSSGAGGNQTIAGNKPPILIPDSLPPTPLVDVPSGVVGKLKKTRSGKWFIQMGEMRYYVCRTVLFLFVYHLFSFSVLFLLLYLSFTYLFSLSPNFYLSVYLFFSLLLLPSSPSSLSPAPRRGRNPLPPASNAHWQLYPDCRKTGYSGFKIDCSPWPGRDVYVVE